MASFFSIGKHLARVRRDDGHAPLGSNVARLVGSGHISGASAADSGLSGWATTSTPRKQVQPPALFSRAQPLWLRWMVAASHWLWDDAEIEDHPRFLQSLNQVKTEFLATVWDLQSYNAAQVREHVTQAHSLRELWHLRADVFRVIAIHRGQAEADLRLDTLNRHFPVKISPASSAVVSGRLSRW